MSLLGETFWADRAGACRGHLIGARSSITLAVAMLKHGRADRAIRFLEIELRRITDKLDALEREDAQKLEAGFAAMRAAAVEPPVAREIATELSNVMRPRPGTHVIADGEKP